MRYRQHLLRPISEIFLRVDLVSLINPSKYVIIGSYDNYTEVRFFHVRLLEPFKIESKTMVAAGAKKCIIN